MAGLSMDVNRADLESAIQTAEKNGPLKNLSALYITACDLYNEKGHSPITPAVVRLRAVAWQIKVQTQPGRRFNKEERQPRQTHHFQSYGLQSVVVPSGKCPAKLANTEYDTVVAWGKSVIEHGVAVKLKYGVSALAYFAREFVDFNTPEFREVRAIIVENFTEQPPEEDVYQEEDPE